MIWYDMIWYDMIWYDMIWYDMIWTFLSTWVHVTFLTDFDDARYKCNIFVTSIIAAEALQSGGLIGNET
jgi:hypothetical protein